jgi:hypothetical protein
MFNSKDLEAADSLKVSMFTPPEQEEGRIGEAVMDIFAVKSKFKFNLHDIVMHYKGGTYYIVGTPDEYVIEATREPAYAYLMEDGRVCVRSQAEMESNLEGGEVPRFARINPPGIGIVDSAWMNKTREWIQAYHEKLAKMVVTGEARTTLWLTSKHAA